MEETEDQEVKGLNSVSFTLGKITFPFLFVWILDNIESDS